MNAEKKKKRISGERPRLSNGLCGTNRFCFPEKRIKSYFERNESSHEVDFYSSADPNGMYTGVPKDIYDEPIQDADDL